jgi:TorA maturation chaperone TorD
MEGSGTAVTNAPDNKTELQPSADDTAIPELIEVLEQRAATYMLLSRLYQNEIDQELLDEMHARLYPAEYVDNDLYTGYLYIATYLSNIWSGSLRELRIDFARCFLGHGVDGFSAAYPYESVYTSEKRLMMQAARDEVLAIYRAYGIEKTANWKEGEDHLALELEFERILCNKAIQAFLAGNSAEAEELLSAQLGFLENHLIAWVPMLIADMKNYAKTKMYLGLAYLTSGFLRADHDFLNGLLSDSDGAQEGPQDARCSFD